MLPFTVTVLIPAWIARGAGTKLVLGPGLDRWMGQAGGGLLLFAGLILFVTSLRRFGDDGDGTLAPWDPPRRLVIRGPYRYVRNPMISGVVFVLFGEAALFLSRPHAEWAITFLAINLVYIPLFEEPGLRRRFGESYDRYRRHVPAIFPRLTPWVDD